MKPYLEEAKMLLFELNGDKNKVPIMFVDKIVYIKANSKNRMLITEFMSNEWSWKILINHLDKEEACL